MGKKKSKNKSSSVSDYVVYAIYRIFESFLRLFPMEVVCCIGAGLGQLAYYLMPRRRQIVLRNLRIAYGDQQSPQQIQALVRKTFRTSGLNLIASITASTLSNEELIERVQIEGLENIIDVYKKEKGCILLLGHMGNWEVLTQLKILIPEIESLASLYRPLNNSLLDRLVKRRRQSRGASLYSRKDGFAMPITHLKSGGTLGVIADQSAGKHGMPVPFFGKLASMTNLPALLHRKTKAPILPLSMCTVSPGRWKVVLHPAVEVSEDELKDTYQITARCAQAYENLMTESPSDVLWMHNYWRGGNRTALKIRGSAPRNLKPSDLPFSKAFYLLAYIPPHFRADTLTALLAYLRSCRPDLHITLAGDIELHTGADQTLTTKLDEPPHLAANTIRNYQDSLPAPFDCALDLTSDGTGTRLLEMADIDKIFALNNHKSGDSSETNGQTVKYEDHLKAFITRISPSPE